MDYTVVFIVVLWAIQAVLLVWTPEALFGKRPKAAKYVGRYLEYTVLILLINWMRCVSPEQYGIVPLLLLIPQIVLDWAWLMVVVRERTRCGRDVCAK